jgi:hypothetical protein
MTDKLVQSLASGVAHRLKEAKDSLHEQMKALGLTPEAGWRISEELRHTIDGTEWVFKPIHLREHAPHELCTNVRIDHEGRLL